LNGGSGAAENYEPDARLNAHTSASFKITYDYFCALHPPMTGRIVAA
jgi:plastocyanin